MARGFGSFIIAPLCKSAGAGVALLLFLSCAISTQAGGEKSAVTRCVLSLDPEIDCPSCEDRLKHLLETAHGVQSADIDVLTNRIVVRYDPLRINVRTLIGRIAVTGYTASEVK